MQPEARVRRDLRRVRGWTWAAHLLLASAAALTAAASLSRFSPIATTVGAVAAAAGVLVALRARRTARHSARLLERAAGGRNVVITAEELLAHPERASGWMRERVMADAARLTTGIRPWRAVSLGLPAAACAVAITIAALAFMAPARDLARRVRDTAIDAAARTAIPSGPVLTVVLEPPAYTGLGVKRLVAPSRIEAVAGTVARISLRGGLGLRFGAADLTVVRDGETMRADVRLAESGYIAAEAAGGRVLVPVVVTPDHLPQVRIERPGRDLFVADANRAIPVAATASDDLAVAALELRYTKVSGTGEDFEFVEGSVPVRVTRSGDRTWRAAGEISLAALKLEPGDSLVYRAVARDRRPGGGGEASSDTFFVEVAGPGQVALEGFELPPEQERYALSQQMVVLKIERLRARERALARGALAEEAAAIAAEQRAVRAYFVFLMGGHVEDEEVEAEQSHEIQEGRLENTARREISAAVHLMTRAEQGLSAANTGAALPPAKSAVEALQRAFGHNRYILRTPPARTEIDMSRRSSGPLGEARDWRRTLAVPDPDPRVAAVQRLAGELMHLLTQPSTPVPPGDARLSALAEQALAIAPASPEWQGAAAAITAGHLEPAARLALELLARQGLASAPAAGRRASPLVGAWMAEGKQ